MDGLRVVGALIGCLLLEAVRGAGAEEGGVQTSPSPIAGTYRFVVTLGKGDSVVVYARTERLPMSTLRRHRRDELGGDDRPAVGYYLMAQWAAKPGDLPQSYDERGFTAQIAAATVPFLETRDSAVWRGDAEPLRAVAEFAPTPRQRTAARRLFGRSESLRDPEWYFLPGSWIVAGDGRVRFEWTVVRDRRLVFEVRGERISLDVLSSTSGQRPASRVLVAVFAHPDDERIVGPLLARSAREGHRVHLVIATDGSKGVREHAGIAAGAPLARARAEEARCAAERLGIEPPILLGLEDAGLASFASLGRLRDEVTRSISTLRPDAVFTIGPEGGTGHPDHRLVGNVVTEVVQGIADAEPPALYYASLPAERMRDAPPARPSVTAVPERYLPVQVPFTPPDLEAARAAFACHASQYTEQERDAINRALAQGFAGRVHLRPWDGSRERASEIFP